MWFNKENIKIYEVSEFSIWPYEQNWNLGNLGKFLFALNFDGSTAFSVGKLKILTEILNEWTSYLLIQRSTNTI